jgi:hypothetical protein
MLEKVFVNENNIAVFICPECKKSRNVDVSKYKNLCKASKIKCNCPCGHSYNAILEKRKHYRKQTNLPGIYVNIVSSIGTNFLEEVGRGTLRVTDISRTGIQFTLNIQHDFSINDKILVEFRLDDKQKTLIKKEVIIKNINGLKIGAEFLSIDPSDPSDKAIGFYLLK